MIETMFNMADKVARDGVERKGRRKLCWTLAAPSHRGALEPPA